MDAQEIAALAQATQDSSLPFAQIVQRLMAQEVESYLVDFARGAFTFYGPGGATVAAPLRFEGLPPIAPDFDAAALKAAILDSQLQHQPYRAFCARALQAGVQGYFAFLRGQRVSYFGRQGDQHTEWFPGARPAEA